jgi:hypothetical protein
MLFYPRLKPIDKLSVGNQRLISSHLQKRNPQYRFGGDNLHQKIFIEKLAATDLPPLKITPKF